MIEILDLQISYVLCFQNFYGRTRRIPTWYVTHHKNHSHKFSKLYSILMQYNLLNTINTVHEFFLYTFAVGDSPLAPEQLGHFIYVGDFLKNGRRYGKDLRIQYIK